MSDSLPTDAQGHGGPMSEGLAALRSGAGWIQRTMHLYLEALLHPRRHRKARALVRSHRSTPRVVVVCLGNICRSPYAGVLLRQILSRRGGSGVEVISAGLVGPGRSVPAAATAAAGVLAPELASHTSQLVSRKIIRPGDLVVVMSRGMVADLARHLRYKPSTIVLGDLDSERWHGRTITDPWGEPQEVFDTTFRRIDRCVAMFAEEWCRP